MNGACPQYPLPYYGLEMQNPYFGMDYPYYPTQELMQYPYYPGLGMQYPYYPCPMPMPGPIPGPVMGYPPVEVQRMVREMLEMVRSIYEEECPGQS